MLRVVWAALNAAPVRRLALGQRRRPGTDVARSSTATGKPQYSSAAKLNVSEATGDSRPDLPGVTIGRISPTTTSAAMTQNSGMPDQFRQARTGAPAPRRRHRRRPLSPRSCGSTVASRPAGRCPWCRSGPSWASSSVQPIAPRILAVLMQKRTAKIVLPEANCILSVTTCQAVVIRLPHSAYGLDARRAQPRGEVGRSPRAAAAPVPAARQAGLVQHGDAERERLVVLGSRARPRPPRSRSSSTPSRPPSRPGAATASAASSLVSPSSVPVITTVTPASGAALPLAAAAAATPSPPEPAAPRPPATSPRSRRASPRRTSPAPRRRSSGPTSSTAASCLGRGRRDRVDRAERARPARGPRSARRAGSTARPGSATAAGCRASSRLCSSLTAFTVSVPCLLTKNGQAGQRLGGQREHVALVGHQPAVQQRDRGLVAEHLDVQRAAAGQVEQPLAQLGRAGAGVRAAPVDARPPPRRSAERGAAVRARGREHERALRARRAGPATGPTTSGITSPALRSTTMSPISTPLRCHLVGVVQGGPVHRGAADLDRLHHRERRDPAGAARR